MEIRSFERSDSTTLIESVPNLLGERKTNVILDIRDVPATDYFCGALMRVLSRLERPVPLIVSKPMVKLLSIVCPLGQLWWLFEEEAESVNYCHRRFE